MPLEGGTAAARSTKRVFGALSDVACPVSVVLGTGTISVRQCLALSQQMVLRLSQSAGEDLQVIAGAVMVARGEVVIVEDSTAVRLTEIARNPELEYHS